ncbi:MAG: hypothetical protein JEY94_02620 [Melioribacteraceae bacterium]|nr:hypothetical protein [Melioribacteraceae bacterium]
MQKNQKEKIIILAPFWSNNKHVGVYRVDRFKRWLDDKYEIVIINSGTENSIVKRNNITEIFVKDPILIISNMLLKIGKTKFLKIFYIFWNTLLYYFLPSDQYYFWAKKISDDKNVKKVLKNVRFVLSTSPPNSSHIGGYLLSKKYEIPFVADFRDGWLDEPLRPIIEKWKWRRRIEGEWEKKVVLQATNIFVTSELWKEKIDERYKNISNKTTVLTNGYPQIEIEDYFPKINENNVNQAGYDLKLIYTGNFTVFRKMELLLQPIIKSLKNKTIEISLLGDYRQKDLIEVNQWQKKIEIQKSNIKVLNRMPRDLMIKELLLNDGLLLLSASTCAIPSKLFEYIITKKPILAITKRDSAVWRLCKSIPQIFLFSYITPTETDYENVKLFLEACYTSNYDIEIPHDFTEKNLKQIFIDAAVN